MAKTIIHGFYVYGSGVFPLQLLQPETAWPAQEADLPKLTLKNTERVRVEMRSLCPPTVKRWKDVGWSCSDPWRVA